MMGAGKSSVGRALAELSGRQFVDTDLLLQHRFGRPVHQIFRLYGEAAFRAHETSVLKSLNPGPIVLATGGGIVGEPANWTELGRLGVTIYLKANYETLLGRLESSKKKRPLLMEEKWPDRVRELLDVRCDLYDKADLIVNIDDLDISNIAMKIYELLQQREHWA